MRPSRTNCGGKMASVRRGAPKVRFPRGFWAPIPDIGPGNPSDEKKVAEMAKITQHGFGKVCIIKCA